MANTILCATCEYTQADFDRILANGGEPLIIDRCVYSQNKHWGNYGYWVDNVLTFKYYYAPEERKKWLVWRKNWKWNPEGDLKAMYTLDIDAFGAPTESQLYYYFFTMYAEKQLHAIHI